MSAEIIRFPIEQVRWTCEHCGALDGECMCFGVCLYCGGGADVSLEPDQGALGTGGGYWCDHCERYSIVGSNQIELRRD